MFGLVLEAAVQHQEGSRHPDAIHATAYFLKSAQVGPFEVRLRELKAGRDFKHLSAALVQNVCGPVCDERAWLNGIVQDDERVLVQLIFGRLVPEEGSLGREPMTLEPPSPYAVLPPLPTRM